MSFLLLCDQRFYNRDKDIQLEITKGSYLSNMMSDPKNKGTLFSSILKVGETSQLTFMIGVHPDELWALCHFMKVPENPSKATK